MNRECESPFDTEGNNGKKSLNVYFVDDEEVVIEWLLKNVDWESYDCKIVGFSSNVEKALRDIEELSVDLLFTDICMPGISGLELIQRVRVLHQDISIVIISAHDKFSYVKEALKYGIINYCLKPIDVDEIVECVKLVWNACKEKNLYQNSQEERIFRKNVLLRLIKNRGNDEVIYDQSKMAGIDLDVLGWQLVLIDIRRLEKKQYLYLLNYFKEESTKEYYCFQDEDMNFVLLFWGKEVLQEKQVIQDKIKHVFEQVGASCYVGKPVQSYWQIPTSYQVCRDFLNAGLRFQKPIVWVEDYPYKKYLDPLPQEELQQLSDYLKLGDGDCILKIFKSIVDSCKTEEEKKAELICLTVFLMKTLSNDFKKNESVDLIKESVVGIDVQLMSEELLGQLKLLIKQISMIDEVDRRCNHPYIIYSLEQIRWHYADSNLSLQEIAKKLNISSAYLGKLFREQTGEFFNEYLLKIRLEIAVGKLSDSRINIGEIAMAVGYSNQSYFNKSFRKHYGMSPIEYRRRLQKNV